MYMAPEIKHEQQYEGKPVDIFACAIILFIMVTGHFPFKKPALNDQDYLLLC